LACKKGSSTSAEKAQDDRVTATLAVPRHHGVGYGQDSCLWGQCSVVSTWSCQPEWDGLYFGSCSTPSFWYVYKGGLDLILYREGGIKDGSPLLLPSCGLRGLVNVKKIMLCLVVPCFLPLIHAKYFCLLFSLVMVLIFIMTLFSVPFF